MLHRNGRRFSPGFRRKGKTSSQNFLGQVVLRMDVEVLFFFVGDATERRA
jgi:hypothetical protein